MNIPDVVPAWPAHVKEMRRLGFGFAVDDAGAGYASFTLIAALRPSIIKIDREIVRGIGDKRGDAKQALVEAFVSFGRRIGAQLVAEGIETRRELVMLRSTRGDLRPGLPARQAVAGAVGAAAAGQPPARRFVRGSRC